MEGEPPCALIERIALDVLTPRCDPNSEGFVAYAHLAADIREVLPYLNAILSHAVYNPAVPAVTWRRGSHHVAFHPDQIAVSGLADRQEANEEVEAIVNLVNDTWARRAEIEPDHRARQRPGLMVVHQLLPRSNCRACGESTCFSFAGKLVTGRARLDGCPQLDEAAYAEQRTRLAEMAWDLV